MQYNEVDTQKHLMNNFFKHLSQKVSRITGSPVAFVLAFLSVIIWLISGPYAHFSNTWLMSIATVTDVIIFLTVFSLQYSQNRDSKAIQLKLNELISADQKARDSFIGLEEMTDDELEALDNQFQKLLKELEQPEIIRKLHKSIKHEKSKRPSFYKQAENIVEHVEHIISG